MTTTGHLAPGQVNPFSSQSRKLYTKTLDWYPSVVGILCAIIPSTQFPRTRLLTSEINTDPLGGLGNVALATRLGIARPWTACSRPIDDGDKPGN